MNFVGSGSTKQQCEPTPRLTEWSAITTHDILLEPSLFLTQPPQHPRGEYFYEDILSVPHAYPCRAPATARGGQIAFARYIRGGSHFVILLELGRFAHVYPSSFYPSRAAGG